MIPTLRTQLTAAAQHAPQSARGYINTLVMQLGRYARANPEDKAALRPAIEQIITRIERAARDGR